MAVWPFCLPYPRTSVTVMPATFIFPSASLTSSTLFGRMMALIIFIGRLQSSAAAAMSSPVQEGGGGHPSRHRHDRSADLEQEPARQNGRAEEELPVHHSHVTSRSSRRTSAGPSRTKPRRGPSAACPT